MSKHLLPDETPEKRLEYLESTADQVVEERYYQRLDQDELTAKKAEFTQNALDVDDLEEQKKEVLNQFKESLKPLKETHSRLASEIRTGFVEKHGRLYVYVDEKTRMVKYYDQQGELIESKTRPANADELQKTIRMSLRTGTDN